MYDIIVIGAGTAGLTASIYARRASKSVLVIEAESYGGQIISTPHIQNYPVAPDISGFEFAEKIYNQSTELGTEFVFEKAVGIEIDGNCKTVKTESNSYSAKAVIIATGSENRKLGLENENYLIGRGVSYCATCDGAFYRKKTVAVVGGGNTAVEDALYLSDIAETVYLIHRRDSFRADQSETDKLKEKSNVKLLLNSNVTKLLSDKKLTGIEVTDTSGQTSSISVDGLFVAIGRIPENSSFSSVIQLDSSGYAVAGENCRTSADGIFVAGDNRTKEVRQLVTATADGAVSATEAVKYINSLN